MAAVAGHEMAHEFDDEGRKWMRNDRSHGPASERIFRFSDSPCKENSRVERIFPIWEDSAWLGGVKSTGRL
jgi:hypothetical protein